MGTVTEGIVVPHPIVSPEVHPFLNSTFGAAMNQNIAFSGTPEIIHNGLTSTEWTGTAVQGDWNFADAGKVTITSASDGDNATFLNPLGTIDMGNFTTLTGLVDLDIYNVANNAIIIQFDNGGTPVGTSIDLNDFIESGNFDEQTFVIPKAAFGLSNQLIDGMTLTITRSGGAPPTIKFDNMQWEEEGDPATFKSTTPIGTLYHIAEIRVRLTANIDTTLVNASVPNYDLDSILGITALTNGIIFTRTEFGDVKFSLNLKTLDDFFATGFNLINNVGNATKSGFTLTSVFPSTQPLMIEGGGDDNFLSFTINDDLSSLARFTAVTRGGIEIMR